MVRARLGTTVTVLWTDAVIAGAVATVLVDG